MTFVINGKFLIQRITGVQRYAYEITKELDKIVSNDFDVEIVVPFDKAIDAKKFEEYKNIKIKTVGTLNGFLWEQISLPLYVFSNKSICVSMCMFPFLAPHILVIHDINFKVNPHFFAKKVSIWYRIAYAWAVRRAKHIITVSQFSRSEIIKYYKINSEKITVIYNSWQHYEKIKADESTMKKYKLNSKDYFFAMGSITQNKNFKWIYEIAKKNPKQLFVVSGNINSRFFGKNFFDVVPNNLLFLNYVRDEEAKVIMRECKAFLFPSFYEGFGIPPLEALSVGADIVISNTSALPEIYGESAHYINPHDYTLDLDKLVENPKLNKNETLEKYSWNKSAKQIYELLKSFY